MLNDLGLNWGQATQWHAQYTVRSLLKNALSHLEADWRDYLGQITSRREIHWRDFEYIEQLFGDPSTVAPDQMLSKSYSMIHPNMIPTELLEARGDKTRLPFAVVAHPNLVRRYLDELDWDCRTDSPQITQDLIDGCYGDDLREYLERECERYGGIIACQFPFFSLSWLNQHRKHVAGMPFDYIKEDLQDYGFRSPWSMYSIFDQVVRLRWRFEF